MNQILEAERQLGHTPLSVIYGQYLHHLRFQLPLLGYLLSREVEQATNYKHVIIEGIKKGPNGEIDGKKTGEVDCRIKMSEPYSFETMEERNFAFRATSTSSEHLTGNNFFHTVRVQLQNGGPKLFFEMPVPRNRSLDPAIGFQPDPSSFLRFCALPGLAPSWYVVSKNKWNDFDYPLDGKEDETDYVPIGRSIKIDDFFIKSALKGQLPGLYSENPNNFQRFSGQHFDNMMPYPPLYRRYI